MYRVVEGSRLVEAADELVDTFGEVTFGLKKYGVVDRSASYDVELLARGWNECFGNGGFLGGNMCFSV